MHFKVKQIETGQIHLVWKLLDTLEGQHIWSVTWEGHHIIGQDCEWYSAPPTTEQTELWKEVEQVKTFYQSKITHALNMGGMGLVENLKEQMHNAIAEKYSITSKQEVPEAVEFAEWIAQKHYYKDVHKEWYGCERGMTVLIAKTTAELFQLFKTPTNAPAQTH